MTKSRSIINSVVTKVRVIISLLMMTSVALSAQVNSHYWSHQYGSKGQLMNGSIIASVNDETAVFYNPGAISLTDEFGVALSLITPSYGRYKTNDFLGDNTSFKHENLGLSPGLVAAIFQPFNTDRISVGLTTFTRFRSSINVEDRFLKLVFSNNNQIFQGEVDFHRRINESWFGVALSGRITDQLAIGFTQFVTFRSERVILDFKKEILDRSNPAELVAGWRSEFEMGYSANGGTLTKVGVCWQPGDIKLGATLTTATYGVADGRADYAFDDQKVNFAGTNTASSNDRRIKLSNYETPLSIGLGIEVPLTSSILSVSTEYFSAVRKYNIIDDIDDPLDGLSGESSSIRTTVGQAKSPVLNFGFGIEQEYDEQYTYFYGFRTDFSPNNLLDLGEGISFLANTPDIYHISGGLAYSYQKSQFSVGLDYGFGYKVGGKQLTDIANISEENIFEFSGDDSVNTVIHQIQLFVTYDL